MSKYRRIRLLLLLVLLVSLVLVGRYTPAGRYLDPDLLRETMRTAGVWGVLAFLAAFSVCQLCYTPGLLFVALGVMAYGQWWGGGLSYVGAVLSVCVSFLVVRTVGGKALGDIDRPLMRRILGQLDKRPVRATIVLRLLFIMNPALNYALGLSTIRFRDYAIGSALGLIGPIAVATALFEVLVRLYDM